MEIKETGNYIREERGRVGFTLERLAAKTGIPVSTLSRYQNSTDVPVSALQKIADAMDIPCPPCLQSRSVRTATS